MPKSGRRIRSFKGLSMKRRRPINGRIKANEKERVAVGETPSKVNGGDETIAGHSIEYCVCTGFGRIAMAGNGQRGRNGNNWVVFITFVGIGCGRPSFPSHAPEP